MHVQSGTSSARSSKTYLFDHMSEELQAQMEKIRLGKAGEE